MLDATNIYCKGVIILKPKRLLAVLLTLILTCSFVTSASAASCGEYVDWTWKNGTSSLSVQMFPSAYDFYDNIYAVYQSWNDISSAVSIDGFTYYADGTNQNKDIQIVGAALTGTTLANTSIDFNNSHILTVAVLTAPNKHAKKSDLMSNSYGMVLSYELAPRDGTRSISTNKICSDPTKYLELNYQGLMLNLDFDAANNATTQFPPQNIFAKAGETITLAYRAGNYENASELMVIVLIDWKQSQINDVNSLYIRNKPGYIGYGELNITTPLQAGEYEVTAFVVDSPFSLRDFNTFHTHDTAYRFTLTVQ